jgi:hypothetical protein
MGRHTFDDESEEAERYGRHTPYRDEAVLVKTLLTRASKEGRSLRLAWQSELAAAPMEGEMWPTGVMKIATEQPENE